MKHKYFGGSAEDLSVVNPLPQTSFKTFVLEVLGNPTRLGITRDAYRGLTKKAQHEAKRAPFFTACTFSGAKRSDDEAQSSNLITLDLDDENRCMADVYLRAPWMLAKVLSPYSFAAYTSASSTSTNPRMRIVVDADLIPFNLYIDAVFFVARSIGLPTVNPETLRHYQPMYVPSLFAEESMASHNPLVSTWLEGRPLRVSDLTPSSATAPLPITGYLYPNGV